MKAKNDLNESRVVAYLDIETTGLSPCYHDITVIGIYRHNGTNGKFIQLYGKNVNRENLKAALEGISTIYTYNGSRFDLPFIKDFLGIDIESEFEIQHCDLMYKCWENNLKGGFKSVERQLGIDRDTTGVDGAYAVYLWNQYLECYDLDALELLLKYNRDDVINLKTVKDKLSVP